MLRCFANRAISRARIYADITPPLSTWQFGRQMGNDLRVPKKHLEPHFPYINRRDLYPGWMRDQRLREDKYCLRVLFFMV